MPLSILYEFLGMVVSSTVAEQAALTTAWCKLAPAMAERPANTRWQHARGSCSDFVAMLLDLRWVVVPAAATIRARRPNGDQYDLDLADLCVVGVSGRMFVEDLSRELWEKVASKHYIDRGADHGLDFVVGKRCVSTPARAQDYVRCGGGVWTGELVHEGGYVDRRSL